ncbi:MAG: glycosyltransferase [Pseudomonadales bacterium]|nr:glycosyltransferase [Pseudomonadales bacterium]
MTGAAPKRILIITTSYPMEDEPSGGAAAGAFVEDFGVALADHCEVHVLAPGRSKQLGKQVSRYYSGDKPLSNLSISSFLDLLIILRVLMSGTFMSFRLMKRYRFDHVLCCWVLPSGFWGYLLNKFFGVQYSTWALGSDIWSLGKLSLARRFLRTVLKHAKLNYADGFKLAEDVEELSSRDCSFLPSTRTIKLANEKEVEGPFNYAFVGRWHENKGADLLCEALCHLSDEEWQQVGTFYVCGDGPQRDQLLPKFKSLINAGRPIELLGYVDKAQAESVFQDSHFLVIPSRIESIPVVFSDGVASLCGIVSTPVGDLPRLLQTYHCGVLLDEVSSDAILKGLSTSLQLGNQSFLTGLHNAQADFSQQEIVKRYFNEITT